MLFFETGDFQRQQLNEFSQNFHYTLIGLCHWVNPLLNLDGLYDGQNKCRQILKESHVISVTTNELGF